MAIADPGTIVAQGPLPPPLGSTEPRRGAAPPLPPIEPLSKPEPVVETPAAPSPASGPMGQGPRFRMHGVRLDGNTKLDAATVDGIVGPYVDKAVSLADLEEIRRQLTVAYIQKGYLNSGVVIPDQHVGPDGIVKMTAVEGRVTEIDVTGTDHFAPDYFRARLGRGLQTPFNVKDVEEVQQILLQDPLVRRLNIELLPGLVPGEATLRADVLEGQRFGLQASVANDQSPTVGETRGQLRGTAANLLGYGDLLVATYGKSQGLDDGSISYSVPILSDDTRINLHYDRNGTLVIDQTLSPLNITSQSWTAGIGISRPFYRTAESALTLGINAEYRSAQTFLLDEPFAFTTGSDNGKTNVTVMRFYADWLDRDADHAFNARSTISFGIHALGATVTNTPPTGKFTSWLGQAQYVRRVFGDWEAVGRGALQLSNHPLFPLEQFPLGGIDNVRGYRNYLTVTDDAFVGSIELRIPLFKARLPYLASTDDAGMIQFVPFYDYGRGWNVDRPTAYPPDISSLGGGFRWNIGSGVLAELYLSKPLRHVSAGTALSDRGIQFRLTASLY